MYPVLWVVLTVCCTLVPSWLFGLLVVYGGSEGLTLTTWLAVCAAAWTLYQSSIYVHTLLCRLGIKSEFWPIIPITLVTAVWSVAGLFLYLAMKVMGGGGSSSLFSSVLSVSIVCSALFLMELVVSKEEFPVIEPCDAPTVDLDEEPNWPSRVPIPHAVGMLLAGTLVYAVPAVQVSLAVVYWDAPSLLPSWLLGSGIAWALLLAFSQLNIRLALPMNSDWSLTAAISRMTTRAIVSFLVAWSIYGLGVSFLPSDVVLPTGLLVACRLFPFLSLLLAAVACWASRTTVSGTASSAGSSETKHVLRELTWG